MSVVQLRRFTIEFGGEKKSSDMVCISMHSKMDLWGISVYENFLRNESMKTVLFVGLEKHL